MCAELGRRAPKCDGGYVRGLIAKRVFDLVFAAIGLVVLSPLLLGIAISIWLDSPGPVFFRQERVGRYGKLFRIHKFRTMHVDSEKSGPLVTSSGDGRITRVGKVLRGSKLDELAQLIDVVKGDMSLVGARPEVPKYVAYYPAAAKEKILSLRPGITDPASINYIREEEILAESNDPEHDYIEKILPQKLLYYQEYVDQRSLFRDTLLILQTLKAMFA